MSFFKGTVPPRTPGEVYIARREEINKIFKDSGLSRLQFARKYLKHKHGGYFADMLAGRRTISERIILMAREAAKDTTDGSTSV